MTFLLAVAAAIFRALWQMVADWTIPADVWDPLAGA